MTYSLTWLPDVLRGAKLKVIEQPGWKTRGHGDIGKIQLVICHHTVSHPGSDHPDLGIVTNGRPGLSGPLAQLLLSRNGTYYAIAAGLAYHAGDGHWPGVYGGNEHAIGIEAENNGTTEVWPEVQMDAYARGVAAILHHLNLHADHCIGHKEWAPHRKSDPDFDMNVFRARVAKHL